MPIVTRIADLHAEITAWRHDLHAHPELRSSIALFGGVLSLIMPRLQNYIVAIYLIVVGLLGINGIYHFIK